VLKFQSNKCDKDKDVDSDKVNKEWIDSGKSKLFRETSALKVQGLDEVF